MAKRITIGADHGGFLLKEKVISELKKKKYKVSDLGPSSKDSCDYPAFGFSVAKKVSKKQADRGILICRSGIGMAIVANKLPGVRAGVCNTVKDASSSREHNDANVLVLAADRVSSKKALEILNVWLKTKTLGGRHARRVRQIKDFEKKIFKKL
ncbi:ribose 5-phosphate isomerase B [Candidatus Omnitrophota bacterium]